MNKFTVMFLILFFLAAITVGVLAVRQRLSTTGKGVLKCPPQTLPSPGSCPQGEKPTLVKNERGCYVFICR